MFIFFIICIILSLLGILIGGINYKNNMGFSLACLSFVLFLFSLYGGIECKNNDKVQHYSDYQPLEIKATLLNEGENYESERN